MTVNEKIIIHSLGDSFRKCTRIVEERLPQPAPHEIRVRNHFAGVNGVYDQMMCLDRVEHTRVVPPADTGVEAVGIVDAAGDDVDSVAVGDAVAVVNVGHAYRRWQNCDAALAIPVAEPTPRVLALIPSGVSALIALERVAEMTSDETVCITAAAGGLGNVMTQLAVNAGNGVIAICGSDEKADALSRFGVARIIQYRREPVEAVIADEYGDRLDIVMDSVGGSMFDCLVANLAPFGRLVICGFTSDRLPTEVVQQERIYTRLYWKAASVRGFMNYRFARYAADARRRLLAMFARGEIVPLVDPTPFHGLGAVADAVEYLLTGANVGKVVVDLR
ncbi:MAG: zinc-binding dehydrogenase [Woeseiaceae bacterium]|nr:zinc-binding dehydrogenase [Woeseiaceae bacterium]